MTAILARRKSPLKPQQEYNELQGALFRGHANWAEPILKGLRSPLRVDPANARVTAHLGRRLADQALKQGSDPDESRRARGEADFLTSRAVRLAPDNEEVKKLRDEVVKLLRPQGGSSQSGN
jgi:hypothetical protein